MLLTKPVVEASFKDKDNKTVTLAISAADGDNVYVRVEGRNEVFKANKSLLESMNFKLTDVVSEPAATKPEDDTAKKDAAEGEIEPKAQKK